jgi:hypothetical protein
VVDFGTHDGKLFMTRCLIKKMGGMGGKKSHQIDKLLFTRS